MIKLAQILSGVWNAIRIYRHFKPKVEPIVAERREKAEEKFKRDKENADKSKQSD